MAPPPIVRTNTVAPPIISTPVAPPPVITETARPAPPAPPAPPPPRVSQAAKAKVLLVGMRMPPNYGPDYTRGFEQNYTALSQQYGTALLPFLLEPIALDRSAYQADNLHPVARAQPALRDHVWKALEPLLR